MNSGIDNLDEKQSLEIKKLQLEIRNLEQPTKAKDWLTLFTPVAQVVVTAGFSIATIIFLNINGAFDLKAQTLEYRKENLQYSINGLKTEKKELEADYKKKDDLIKGYNNRLSALQADSNKLFQKNTELKNKQQSLINDIDNQRRQIDSNKIKLKDLQFNLKVVQGMAKDGYNLINPLSGTILPTVLRTKAVHQPVPAIQHSAELIQY